MLQPVELLRTYALLLQRLCAADGVSIFLAAPLHADLATALVHSQQPPAVAELSTLEAAGRLARELRDAAESDEDAERVLCRRGREPGTLLLRLPSTEVLEAVLKGRPAASGPPRRRAGDQGAGDLRSQVWLGLKFPPGRQPPWPDVIEPLGPESDGWSWLFGLGGALALHSQELSVVLQDPVSQLPARAGFQVQLEQALDESRASGFPLTLILVHPEDLELVAERFGREKGDQVIREVGERLSSALRSTDLVGRFSASVFAAALPQTTLQQGTGVLESLRRKLIETPYRNSSVRLGFSFGVAAFDPASDESALPLLRRADRALTAAKDAGGDKTVVSRAEAAATGPQLDRLSGIFTANLAKDYRNMLLLWDTVTIVAANPTFETLAAQVVDRLFSTFKPFRVGLFSAAEDGALQLVYGRQQASTPSGGDEGTFPLDPEARSLLAEALAEARMVRTPRPEADETAPRQLYALPLSARQKRLGCLLLEGRDEWADLDSSDEIFLRALTSHLSVAFDRTRLAEQEKQRQERERRTLRAEIQELRQAVQEAKLVYRSPQMEELLTTVRRVAPTDATVLITGESGTGKELVARTLHELSNRRQAPLVVVDCTAISDTLIDSELFGHERGAYTGAQSRGLGRLAEADGGTIVLDEIGEMPLRVQSKLLRFVQEKQLTPVGSSRSRKVDVRVIAATHRDLAAEAAAGSFREDLYYRLNVVRLVVPPLRERPEDVLFLAHHCLKRFAIEYQKGVHRISPEAEAALLAHPWPGNVRELENRIRQAVILGVGETVAAADLGLSARASDESSGTAPRTVRSLASDEASGARPRTIFPAFDEASGTSFSEGFAAASDGSSGTAPVGAPGADPVTAWLRLEEALEHQVVTALEARHADAFPLGRWLLEDMVLEAQRLGEGVRSRGAKILGIAETTFRRRLRKAQAAYRGNPPPRPAAWEEALGCLQGLLQICGESGDDLPLEVRRRLLQRVARHVADDVRRGASLMGISEPTYRRWIEEL